MRRLVGICVAALAAVAVSQAFARGTASGIVAKVPLPAPGAASVRVLTVTVKTNKPHVGPLKLTVLNDKAFGNASAVAVVTSSRKASTHSTYQVAVLVRRFGTPERSVASGGDQFGLRINFTNALGPGFWNVGPAVEGSCKLIAGFDKRFESGTNTATEGETSYTLVSLRPITMQDSPPEEVLDNVLELAAQLGGCPATEGDDPGPK